MIKPLKIIFFIAILSVSHSSASAQYSVQAGLLKVDENGQYSVYKETTTIPLIYKTEDPNFRFGFIIDGPPESKFSCAMKMYLPVDTKINFNKGDKPIPDKYEFVDTETTKELSDQQLIFSTQPTIGYEHFYGVLQFSEKDKPGLYTIEILIDGELFKRIEFTVIREE